jgi:hypothetical protein
MAFTLMLVLKIHGLPRHMEPAPRTWYLHNRSYHIEINFV